MSENNKQEEIDLVQLLRLLGESLGKFFNFIGKILFFIYDFIIKTIIYFKSHFLKIAIAAAVGLGVGYFVEKTVSHTYESSMVVKPNFESTRQLYANIKYYNLLIRNRQDDKLTRIFEGKITKEQAQKLKSISIEPILEENDKITYYNDFVKSLDSVPDVTLDFKKFSENIPAHEIENHKITVTSSDELIFEHLQEPIINSVEENSFFKRRRQLLEGNIEQSNRILSGQLTDIDSLKGIYRQVLVKNAENSETKKDGTIFNFGQDKTDLPDELRLYEEARSINDKIIELNEQRSNLETTTVNVISNLNPIGQAKKSYLTNKYVIAIIFALAALAIILLLEFNKYLINYEKKKN